MANRVNCVAVPCDWSASIASASTRRFLRRALAPIRSTRPRRTTGDPDERFHLPRPRPPQRAPPPRRRPGSSTFRPVPTATARPSRSARALPSPSGTTDWYGARQQWPGEGLRAPSPTTTTCLSALDQLPARLRLQNQLAQEQGVSRRDGVEAVDRPIAHRSATRRLQDLSRLRQRQRLEVDALDEALRPQSIHRLGSRLRRTNDNKHPHLGVSNEVLLQRGPCVVEEMGIVHQHHPTARGSR